MCAAEFQPVHADIGRNPIHRSINQRVNLLVVWLPDLDATFDATCQTLPHLGYNLLAVGLTNEPALT